MHTFVERTVCMGPICTKTLNSELSNREPKQYDFNQGVSHPAPLTRSKRTEGKRVHTELNQLKVSAGSGKKCVVSTFKLCTKNKNTPRHTLWKVPSDTERLVVSEQNVQDALLVSQFMCRTSMLFDTIL